MAATHPEHGVDGTQLESGAQAARSGQACAAETTISHRGVTWELLGLAAGHDPRDVRLAQAPLLLSDLPEAPPASPKAQVTLLRVPRQAASSLGLFWAAVTGAAPWRRT